jgi:hypothetical protein
VGVLNINVLLIPFPSFQTSAWVGYGINSILWTLCVGNRLDPMNIVLLPKLLCLSASVPHTAAARAASRHVWPRVHSWSLSWCCSSTPSFANTCPAGSTGASLRGLAPSSTSVSSSWPCHRRIHHVQPAYEHNPHTTSTTRQWIKTRRIPRALQRAAKCLTKCFSINYCLEMRYKVIVRWLNKLHSSCM